MFRSTGDAANYEKENWYLYKIAQMNTSAASQRVNFKISWGQMYYRKINNRHAISNNRKVLNVYLHSK